MSLLNKNQLDLLQKLNLDPNSPSLKAQIDTKILELETSQSQEFCTQLHIAETEKYNHVTYFFNGGQDKKWNGEEWIVIPSNKVASHAEIPEMKAKEVTDKILEVLGNESLTVNNEELEVEINRFFKKTLTEKSLILDTENKIKFAQKELADKIDEALLLPQEIILGNLAQNLTQKIGFETSPQIIFVSGSRNFGWSHNTKHHREISIDEYAKILIWTVFNDNAEIYISKNNTKKYLILAPIDEKFENFSLCKYQIDKNQIKLVSVWKATKTYILQHLNDENIAEFLENKNFPSQGTADSPIPNLSGMPSGLSGVCEENPKNNKMQIQNCQIREIKPQDCQKVMEIIKNGWLQSDQNQFADLNLVDIEKELTTGDYYKDILANKPENPENKLVLVANNKIIGYSSLMSTQNHISINDLYIQKEFQNLGLGKILFTKILEKAKILTEENDIKQIQIYYGKNNSIAQNLYKKYGFIESETEIWSDEYELENGEKIVLENLKMILDLGKTEKTNQNGTQHKIDSKYDYIIVNFANPDMVGHTGDIPASISSMEFLDEQLGRLLEVIERENHEMIIIADHGNMEFVGEFQENGKTLTDTEHNPSPVPCVFVGNKWRIDNPELENNKQKLYQNLENLNTQNITNLDLELVKKILEQKNQADLTNQENWLKKEQIDFLRSEQLPLWASGALLLSL